MSPRSPGFSLILLLLLSFSTLSSARRRVSQSQKVFEDNSGLDWPEEESQEKEKENTKTTTSSDASTTTSTHSPRLMKVKKHKEKDAVAELLQATKDVQNLTRAAEEELGDEKTNKTVLWIDASYKAMDLNLNVTKYKECIAWRKLWNVTTTNENKPSNETEIESEEEDESDEDNLKETELIEDEKRLKQLGIDENLLDEYRAVGLVYKEICGEHGRDLRFSSTEDAKKLEILEISPICEPFKEELNPDAVTLAKLARKLNDLIQNVTDGVIPSLKHGIPDVEQSSAAGMDDGTLYDYYYEDPMAQKPTSSEKNRVTTVHVGKAGEEPTVHVVEETAEDDKNRPRPDETTLRPLEEQIKPRPLEENIMPKPSMNNNENNGADEISSESMNSPPMYENEENVVSFENDNSVVNYDDDIWDYEDLARRFKVHSSRRSKRGVLLRVRRSEKKSSEDEDDDWMEPIHTAADGNGVSVVEESEEEMSQVFTHHWIEINATDPIHPMLLLSSMEAIEALGLSVAKEVFLRYERVGLYLPGICADYVPKAIDAFNSSSFEGIDIEGPIGVNISALEAAGVNLTALAEKLRNDTEVDDILSRTEGSVKTLGGSFILPVLNKNQYDPFSAPIVFQGSAVVVRFGIYIESMSNFQTTTMDYDMDIYLMMSWRDARLVSPYDKPILVKEEEILEKIWRPDPFFANAKEAEFHEVTFLNFLMRIYPDGLVLYETRVKITPSCNLILCKYPHDKQTCDLLIKSFAYPIETVRFEWFTRRKDAIDKNPDVKLPELYIDRYEPTVCNKTRKSGEFSCLRAVFRLKRDVGFHIAQTYIPTSLALMFSWVGVWLPEEFMEGRIGVAITVLLTLSTESAGAREHLPSVSYLKAIDLWFGFITGFVFFTLLQTLFVIGFDKRANQMRKWAMKKKSDVTEELRNGMLEKAKRYHKTGRYLDNFCRVFYPLSFLLFLIMYYFVFTEGRQDDCINRR